MAASGQILAPERNDPETLFSQITNSSVVIPRYPPAKPIATLRFLRSSCAKFPIRRAPKILRTPYEPKQANSQRLSACGKIRDGVLEISSTLSATLQHLPIVPNPLSQWTGETIGLASRVIGRALWGRIGSFVGRIANGVELVYRKGHWRSHLLGFFGKSEQNRKRLIAKPAKLAFDAGKSQRAVFPAVSQASETMDSAFGDFNDDGGFSVTRRASKLVQSLALPSTSATANGLAALNSYEQNHDFDEPQGNFQISFSSITSIDSQSSYRIGSVRV
jgi:hypothetical protein